MAFWSRILAEGQRRTWTAREKETYAIVCALRKWSGHIGLKPVVVCTDHQSLQSWHKEHVDTPSGPAARRARWHETFAKFDLSVVYVPGKDNTVADCLSRWAYPAGKAWMDISSHGDAEETEEAKRIIEMEKAMEQEGVQCFVVMANRTDLAEFRGARVQAIREETLEQWMVAPVELVRWVLRGIRALEQVLECREHPVGRRMARGLDRGWGQVVPHGQAAGAREPSRGAH